MGLLGGFPRWRLHIAATNAAGPWILAGDVVLVKSSAHTKGHYEPGDLVAIESGNANRCEFLRVNAVTWSGDGGMQYVLGSNTVGAAPCVLLEPDRVRGVVTSRIALVGRRLAAIAARGSIAAQVA